jgi:hypothetical protein
MEKNARLDELILETHGTLWRLARTVYAPAVLRLQFMGSDATMAAASIFGILRGETE